MAATRKNIDRWINTAKEKKYEYIICVCDMFDWDDYPVFCKNKLDLIEQIPKFNRVNIQKIMEIIRINENNTVDEDLHITNFI